MLIDFSKINVKEVEKEGISPREIFMSLPNKDKKYDYPRDVQSDVWDKWFKQRTQKDVIIKMNTGSGKTVVGLLILQSCLKENVGTSVYVVPDSYLVKQVIDEADNLGISVTEDHESGEFLSGKSILVINIHRLINGKSIFGMRSSRNVEIGSMIIDDVHACLNTTEEQFTIKINRNNSKYNKLFKIFSDDLKNQSETAYLDIEDKVPHATMLVPFWSWQNKIGEVNKTLHKNREDEDIRFTYPLLNNSLELCNCIISSENIEIIPKSIPIHKISSFSNAKRRIFMSATLADDSPFISHFNVKPDDVKEIITPENADDIGERLVIIPGEINSKIEVDDIKIKLKELSRNYNVVVIVPSSFRARYWEDDANIIADSSNIYETVEKLKKKHVGLVVFVNKYEGIDLPDDACRVLVIDGLAEIKNGYDKIEQSMTADSDRIKNNIIQKIEQGMGRGIRSNQDYCVVFLLGSILTNVIYSSDSINKFSLATKKQIELSQQMSSQIKGGTIDDIMSLSDYCLGRKKDWIEASKKTLVNTKYNKDFIINPITLAYRRAFDLGEIREYNGATKVIEDVTNSTSNDSLKGWLKQQLAEYKNFSNKVEAQQILKSAIKFNRRLLKPIEGIEFDKINSRFNGQGKQLLDYINDMKLDENLYILKVNSILENLIFKEDTSNLFEESLKELAFIIGFLGYRPEIEMKKGPDVMWHIDKLRFLVIECKNGATNNVICKHDCNQLNGSIVWFQSNYKIESFTPIMIHIGNEFEYASSPNKEIRIINEKKLEMLKNNVKDFAYALVSDGNFRSIPNINKLLKNFKLDSEQFVKEYTIKYKIKNAMTV